MKLKENEVLVARLDHGCYGMGDNILLFGEEAKNLRRNSRNISYWDGSNWCSDKIKEVEKYEYKLLDEGSSSPAYSFWQDIEIKNYRGFKQYLIKIECSNMSGHLRPYWSERSEY